MLNQVGQALCGVGRGHGAGAGGHAFQAAGILQQGVERAGQAVDGQFVLQAHRSPAGLFEQGGTFTQKFDKAGTVAYFCTRHGSMMGEVKVV